MRFFTVCIILGSFVLVFGSLITLLVTKLAHRQLKLPVAALIAVFIGALPIVTLSAVVSSKSYKPDITALTALETTPAVMVTRVKHGWYFDGSGREKALVFYPGAFVDERSYAPLMQRLARGGIDCFLADMPFNVAFFDTDCAERFMRNYNYREWYISGHSLGGVVASMYGSEHSEDIAGLVMLASYATQPIDNSVPLLSVYGSNDEVIMWNNFEDYRANYPEKHREVEVRGGNHSYFGCYGEQEGDGAAEITAEQQQKETAKAIIEFVS